MAGLATGRLPVRPNLLNAVVELALVDIFMTAGAIQVLPVINEIFRLELRRFLVAIGARHREVPTGQRKMSLLMLGECKGGRLVSLQVVAFIAGIEIWGGGKLTGMAVLVAIGAEGKLHPVESVFALGNVALGAFHLGVTALQRVLGGSVLLDREKGRLPALHVMARGALAFVRALGELPVVSVLVAIRTFRERDRLFEVAIGVALAATDLRVFALKGILRL